MYEMESTRLPETFLAAQTPTVCLTLCEEEIRCLYDLILARLCQIAALTNVVLRIKQRNLNPYTWKFMEDLLNTPREEVNRIWEEECSGMQLEIMHVVRFSFDFARRSEVGVHSTRVAWLYIWNCVVLGHIHLPSLLRLNLYTWQSTMRLVHVLSCIGNASSDYVRVVKV